MEIQPITAWSVTQFGIELCINYSSLHSFPDGCSLDVEDNEQGEFVGLGLYDPSSSKCFYWNDLSIVKQLTIPRFVAHNGTSDLEKLQAWGFKVDESFLLWDTQLIEHILDSSQGQYGLKALVKRHFNAEYPSYEDLTGKKKSKDHKTLDQLDPTLVAEYNACDTYWTYKLYERQVGHLSSHGMPLKQGSASQYFHKVEKPAAPVFHAMESRGICVDLPYLRGLKDELEAQKQPLEKAIKNELGDINLNSPKQLLGALNGKGITPEFKGKPSTDKRALSLLKNESTTVAQLLGFSELETLLSSFVNPYLERNQAVVHPFFNQCGTRTGRPSCSNPNLLQIPKRSDNGKRVRRMFVPREGMDIWDSDYKEIEPRMLAVLSKDKNMLELFAKGAGFHSYFAERLNIDRDKAKIFDLETYYRATKYGVARHLGCDLHTAQKEIDKAWELFPELRNWEEKLIWETKRKGYCTTLFGRRIKIDDLDSFNSWKREAAERRLMNNIAQGSASEIIKFGMVKVYNDTRLSPMCGLLVQVYDALTGESAETMKDKPFIIEDMETAVTLDIPLVVDFKYGPNWAEIK